MKIVWVKSICKQPFKGPCRVLVENKPYFYRQHASFRGILFQTDALANGIEYYPGLLDGQTTFLYTEHDVIHNIYEMMKVRLDGSKG
jgi:hypothetical protein